MIDALTFNILVLEDQGLVSAGMRELIKIAEPRAKIFEASNYEEAIALFEAHKFEFSFLDYDLRAERTGLDVLKYLREKDWETRAIMLSACTDIDIMTECLNAGAYGYIPKNLRNDGVFRNALDTIFQGGIFVPEPTSRNGLEPIKYVTPLPTIGPEIVGIKGRQMEVLVYLCQGLTNRAIANKMNISEGTIRKDYVPKLYRILKVTRRTELMLEVSKLRIKLPIL